LTYYRTLGPVTYVNGNTVVNITEAGVKVDLTPTQAAALAGQVVLDDSNQYTYPIAPVLYYKYYVLFPAQGSGNTLYFANDTGLFYRWDDTSNSYVASGVPVNWDSIDTDSRDDLTVGEATMSRRYINGSSAASSGTMTLAFFTARKSETITQVRTITGSQNQTAATLQRIAVYSVDDAGNLSLIASTPSDLTLWAAANTAYTEAFTSSFAKVRGNRYAVGVLCVGDSPSFLGGQAPSAESFAPPMLSARVTGLSDIPSTVVVANLAASPLAPYAVLTP
jgi:hypothetical protein